MAEVKPIRALKYDFKKAGKPEDICSPPYDIVSPEEREALISQNPYNIIRLELPAGDDRYSDAASILRDWLDNGILVRDSEEQVYIYEEEFLYKNEKHKIRGIIANVKLEEFSEKIILPHEETLSHAKSDRFALMENTFCNFSQVYSLYDDKTGSIEHAINSICASAPRMSFKTADGIKHSLWSAGGEAAQALCRHFKGLELYIADGHHRYQTGLDFKNSLKENLPEAGYIMMTLCDINSKGLKIFPTHRLIRNIEGFSAENIINKSKYFDITPLESPENIEDALDKSDGSFCMFAQDKYYIFTLKDKSFTQEAMPGMSEDYRSLDVAVLHTMFLEPVLGIDKDNMQKGKSLTYTRDAKEALDLVKGGEFQAAFILKPTRIGQIAGVSRAGEKMPQKSTYFYPKLITGLVMNQLKDIRI